MSARILVLNGPNLNLLGVREPHIYGSTTLAAVEASCRDLAAEAGIALDFRQTNSEGEMIDWIHEARDAADALVVNPAGLSFRSVAVLDAFNVFDGPVIEIHVSNIHARDEAHRHSLLSQAATAVICGAGAYGYVLAILAAAQKLEALPDAFSDPLRRGPV